MKLLSLLPTLLLLTPSSAKPAVVPAMGGTNPRAVDATTLTLLPTPTATSISVPSPTQPGLTPACTKFYLAVSGDVCVVIAERFGTTFPDFLAWNPAVGEQCQHLIAGWYYCVAAPKVTATATSSTAQPTETCNPAAPKPTMLVEVKCGCKKWHEIVNGDTCSGIIQKYGIGEGLYNWNKGLNCGLLWVGYYVCVGV
ncbi:hypothetical protein C8A05DRAFT_14335 [Staphylotrichum tortipilum]|uniref:LysM domain-containing protein n=1 Tax=Staphylotrichum tortipilum TaxID=2831512 RepID=A0AAN6MMM5_9PEZI|nr:hypothetical protein C8A05DRAFT_14335 [Staphylotrichum longicolle]